MQTNSVMYTEKKKDLHIQTKVIATAHKYTPEINAIAVHTYSKSELHNTSVLRISSLFA